MPGKIADLNVRLGLDLTPFIREIKRVESRLNKFGRKLEGIGRDLSQKVTLPLVGLGGAAIKAFADFDKLQKGLEAVNDSSQAAAQQFDRLRKLAENPGLGLEQAISGAIRLQAIGLEAKDAENTLLQLSKAVALTGTADNLDSVVTQLAQITSKGKILQEDLGVILENAPALAGAFQDAFGTTNAEAIREQVGNVTEFRQRLLTAIAESETFSKVQGSLSNSFNNLGNAIKFSLAQLGQTIAETIDLQGIVDKLSAFIQKLVDKFRALEPRTQKTILLIAGIAAAIGPLLLAIGGFTTLLGTLASGLTVLLSPVTAVVAGIAALAAGIVIAYQRSEVFRNIINVIAQSLPALANVIIERFKAIGGLIGEVFGLIGDVIKILIGPFVNAFNRITEILGISFGDVKNFWESFGDLTVKSLGDFVANIEGTFNGVVRFIKEFVKIIRENIANFTDAFSDLGEGNLKSGFNKLAKALKLNNPLGSIKEEGRRLANAYKEGFDEAFEKVQDDFFTARFGRLKTARDSDFIPTTPDSKTPVSPNDGSRKISKAGAGALGSGLGGANQFGQIAGEALNASENVGALSNALALASQVGQSTIETMVNGFNTFGQSVAAIGEGLTNVQTPLISLQEIAIMSFDALTAGFESAASGAQTFGKAMVKALGQVAKALIQVAVTRAIENILRNPVSGLLGPFAIAAAAAAGKAASSLFTGIVRSIGVPFAKGGIVTGPTNALIGEAGPEAVIPLSPEKLRKYFPNQGGGPVQIFLNDIMIAEAVERGQTKLSRIR